MSVFRPLIVLQPTTFCNIDCKYCYLPERSKTKRMSPEVVRRIATEAFFSPVFDGEIVFLWHLGEPLSVPIEFYEQAFSDIAKIAASANRAYVHSFQTNGMLLDADWISLIRRFDVRIGVSLDGPAFIHDRQRIMRGGKGTHQAVMRGIRLLQDNGIAFGVIAVLTAFSLAHADAFFGFFRDNGIAQVGFNIDEIEGVNLVSSFSADEAASRYKMFVTRLMELAETERPSVKFREVWTTLRSLSRDQPHYNLANRPLRILNVDWQGNFSTFCPELTAASSEKYGDFVMGNILHDRLESIFDNEVFKRVNAEVDAGLQMCERHCEYWQYCGGGEPSSKFFQHGRFDVMETTTCKIHKQGTVDAVLEHLERRLADDNHMEHQ